VCRCKIYFTVNKEGNMVKRYQILLNEWQAEHYRLIAKRYDVSFSEMIRMALAIDIMQATRVAFPKHRFKIDIKMLENFIKQRDEDTKSKREEFHSFISALYYETRKATELWQKKLKNDRISISE
jgi:hypothetical protein